MLKRDIEGSARSESYCTLACGVGFNGGLMSIVGGRTKYVAIGPGQHKFILLVLG